MINGDTGSTLGQCNSFDLFFYLFFYPFGGFSGVSGGGWGFDVGIVCFSRRLTELKVCANAKIPRFSVLRTPYKLIRLFHWGVFSEFLFKGTNGI